MLTNTRQAYGWLTIALHWLAAAAVIAMLYTGFNADWAADRETQRALMRVHIATGASVFLVLMLRVVADYLQPRPVGPEQPKPLMLLASLVHHALLIGILVQIVSGPLAVFSGGRAIDVFGAFSIPSPMARNEGLHEAAELAHAIGRWTIIGALVLHLLGVAKHVIVDRDGVMRRMLIAGKTL
ncbi:cytochrome b [Terricaulis sp.]|uniref:cytochrome b n=1 Tax=Terricaulis sp. TaxID=2768686 RepID=UPI003784203B